MAPNSSWITLGLLVLCGCLFSVCVPTPALRRPSQFHRYNKRSVLDASPLEPWGEIFGSSEDCKKALRSMPVEQPEGALFGMRHCDAFWDGVLCWPATPAGTKVYQSCPNMAGLDPQNFAERSCTEGGQWAGRPEVNAVGSGGWTDYRPCYTPYARALYEKYYGDLK